MKRNPYLPADDGGKMMWLNNFSTKIATYAATLGFNPGEVSDIQADAAQFAFFLNAITTYRTWLQQLTAQKTRSALDPPAPPRAHLRRRRC